MLLEKLSIENYGVYSGKNDFDLSTTPDRPVILVGGYNGAGKTTILESMMIALYGRDYLGKKKPKKEYVEFVLNRMHRDNGKRAGSASIELSFRFPPRRRRRQIRHKTELDCRWRIRLRVVSRANERPSHG